MGKINKHSNLYNNHGELLRHAPLKDYTIAELEELVDKLKAELDNDEAKDPVGYNNAMMMLTQLYQKNPKAQLEFLSKLKSNYTTNTEVKEALHDVLSD